MNLNGRLRALEQVSAEEGSKGWRTVTKCPGGFYGRLPGAPFNFASAIPNEDGSQPDGSEFYTRDDVDQMKAEGWQIIVIEYIENWRGDAAERHAGTDGEA